MQMPGYFRTAASTRLLTAIFSALLLTCAVAHAKTAGQAAPAQPAAPAQAASPAVPASPAAPASPAQPATAVRPLPQQQEAFYVAGLSTHTNNEAEGNGSGQIAALWQKFIQDDVASTIPNKLGDEVYVVYADFNPEHMGTYTYLIGAKVSSIDHLPAGLVARQVPAGRYVIVPSEKGPLMQVIPEMWRRIYAMTPEQLGGKRAFKGDYEIYNLQGIDPSNSQIDAHVGLE